jgi:hypothetical protein
MLIRSVQTGVRRRRLRRSSAERHKPDDAALLAAKQAFDPDILLAPGQGIFTDV